MEVDGVEFDGTCFTDTHDALTKKVSQLSTEAQEIVGHPVLLSSAQQVPSTLTICPWSNNPRVLAP